MITQNCPICHKNFLTKSRNRQICCSSSCGSKLQWNKRKKGKQISCQNCNKILYVSPYRIKDAKFCSRSCTALYNFPKVKKYFIRKGFFREKNPNWKGGKYKTSSGYIMILNPQHPFANNIGYVQEHRLVVEKQLNRFLQPNEVIHHINGIKTDNKIKNLQLLTDSEHKRIHKVSSFI